MGASESGVDRLLQISDELANHERAMQASIGCPSADSEYYGYGGKLNLPDGREYEAYLVRHMDTPGRLQINFYGEARNDPTKITALGHIVLLPYESQISFGAVHSAGRNPGVDRSLHNHTFPGIVALARPLGNWLADGSQEAIDKNEALADAELDFKDSTDRLVRYLGGLAWKVEESLALERADIMMRRALAASRRVAANTTRTLRTPSLQDIAAIDAIVHKPNGASLFIERSGGLDVIAATRVQGPLCGQW
ncbi:MAG TPA: hypothetical protein VJ836_06070 [Candidatus Saccharimonadales bacterium]|nr:hypothetical protein [Candidatus Saccharimonadales bacterium]